MKVPAVTTAVVSLTLQAAPVFARDSVVLIAPENPALTYRWAYQPTYCMDRSMPPSDGTRCVAFVHVPREVSLRYGIPEVGYMYCMQEKEEIACSTLDAFQLKIEP